MISLRIIRCVTNPSRTIYFDTTLCISDVFRLEVIDPISSNEFIVRLLEPLTSLISQCSPKLRMVDDLVAAWIQGHKRTIT